MRTITALLLGALVGAAAGFLGGREVTSRSIPNPFPAGDETEVSRDVALFGAFVHSWTTYIQDHDGYIPADPYRGLIEAGITPSYADIRAIVFESSLPPRINSDLRQNPRAAVFWEVRSDLSEVWTCYANGDWERLTFQQSNQNDPYWWRHAAEKSGLPVWKSLKEKDDWIRGNRNRLFWDSQLKLYVLKPGRSKGDGNCLGRSKGDEGVKGT